MKSALIEQLAAHSTPSRLPVQAEERREQRNWVVRLAMDPAETWNVVEASAVVTRKAASAIREACEARGLSFDNQGPYDPVVRLVPIDARHVVMNITTIKLEEDEAHAYLVAASAALRALDELTPIDDIQGIPRRFWGLLIGP